MKSAYSSTWCFVPRARRAWVWSAGPGGPSAVDGPCELPALEHTAGSVGRTRVRPTHPDLGGQLRTKGRGLPLNKSALLECEGTDMHHTRRAVPVTLQLSVSSLDCGSPSLSFRALPERSVDREVRAASMQSLHPAAGRAASTGVSGRIDPSGRRGSRGIGRRRFVCRRSWSGPRGEQQPAWARRRE